MKQSKSFNYKTFVFFGALVIIAFSIFFSYTSEVARSINQHKRINCLLVGTDLVDHARHTDTIMLLSYEPQVRFLDVLSVPRDTRINIEGYRLNRINAVYAYHYRRTKDSDKSAVELSRVVETVLSTDTVKLEIPYYVEINYESFNNIIDLLGGVWVKIDEAMHYDDYSGGLHIHFEPGNYLLNGQKALEYVRYRDSSGDRGRIYRQQQFFKSVLYKFNNPFVLFKIPQLLFELYGNINTNLSFWDIINLAIEVKSISLKNVRLSQVAGYPRGSLWYIDWERNKKIMELIDSPVEMLEFRRDLLRDIRREDIKIEVFNASGRAGMAKDVTDLLRGAGFDVVNWGNAEHKYNKTLIVDRTGSLAYANMVAGVIKKSEVISRVDMSRMVDISLYIGKDLKNIK